MTRLGWLAVLLMIPAMPAAAETVDAAWDAYFYEAPNAQAHVLDEVRPRERLDVLGCKDGWCRVRFGEAEGYVREIVVRGPGSAEPPAHPAGSTCFQAVQPGGAQWQTEQFCRAGS